MTSRLARRPFFVGALLLALIGSALALLATPARAATLTVGSVADTIVSAGSPNSSYGSYGDMRVDDAPRISLVKFDVSGVPAGATVTGATLTLNGTGSTQPTASIDVNEVSNAWSETTTFNTAPAVGSTITSGSIGRNLTQDYAIPASYVTGNGTFSFALTRSTTGSDNIIATRENGTAADRPALTVTYSTAPPPDTTPPDTTITSAPADSADTSATFSFDSSETGSTFECRLDGAAYASCVSPESYAGLALGAHTFDVRATDAAGNTDASPASHTWTVQPPADTTPPDTTITSGPADGTSTDATFDFTASEAGSTFECRLDASAWAACTSPKSYAGLAVGGHTFDVRATDAAGNTDATPASHAWTIASPPPPPPPAGSEYLIISAADLAALPTSGSAYTAMKSVADGSLGTVNIADQDNQTPGKTLAAALVYARTGTASYKTKVDAILSQLPSQPTANGTNGALALSRQLAGYVIAADLVDYRPTSFVNWVDTIRTTNVGTHGRWKNVRDTSANSCNNWGSWAIASRVAADLFVGDTADLTASAGAVDIFKGFLGDRATYAGFQTTTDFDPSWAIDSTNWQCLNSGTTGKGGAPVEDISRSGGSYPTVDNTGRMYAWEWLGGVNMAARLLKYNGYPDVYTWQDSAILRAGQFMARNGGYPPAFGNSMHIPWMIDKAYGTTLGSYGAAGYGRQFGYTDWLN